MRRKGAQARTWALALSISLNLPNPSGYPATPATPAALAEAGGPAAATLEPPPAKISESPPLPPASSSKTGSLAAASLLPKTPISVDYYEADIRDILRMMATKSGINMIYADDIRGPVTLHLDQVPFDQAFQTVLTLRGLVALPVGDRIIRIVTSTGLTSEQAQAISFTRVFTLNYGSAADVKAQLDAIRTAAKRTGNISVDARMNALVVTDTQEGLAEVERLLPSLDQKPLQVDIEAKLVEVSLNKQTDLGIQWGYAKTLQTRVSGSGVTFKLGASDTPATGATAVSGAEGTADREATLAGKTAFAAAPGTGVAGTGAGAISFAMLAGPELLTARLSALASKNRLKVLSNPHVVTINNQEAKILVGSQIPYAITTVAPGVGQTQSYQFVDVGVKLTVKPVINADRRITLKVKPEVSTAQASASPGVPPQINTRTAETNVLVRDGDTVVIGGLITEDDQKVAAQVPLMGDIPIIGHFFKSTSNRKNRTELIVFITPRIVSE